MAAATQGRRPGECNLVCSNLYHDACYNQYHRKVWAIPQFSYGRCSAIRLGTWVNADVSGRATSANGLPLFLTPAAVKKIDSEYKKAAGKPLRVCFRNRPCESFRKWCLYCCDLPEDSCLKCTNCCKCFKPVSCQNTCACCSDCLGCRLVCPCESGTCSSEEIGQCKWCCFVAPNSVRTASAKYKEIWFARTSDDSCCSGCSGCCCNYFCRIPHFCSDSCQREVTIHPSEVSLAKGEPLAFSVEELGMFHPATKELMKETARVAKEVAKVVGPAVAAASGFPVFDVSIISDALEPITSLTNIVTGSSDEKSAIPSSAADLDSQGTGSPDLISTLDKLDTGTAQTLSAVGPANIFFKEDDTWEDQAAIYVAWRAGPPNQQMTFR